MTPEKWQKLNGLFEEALQRDAAERAAYVASACGGDIELQRELESMLAHDGQAGSLFETPAFQLVAQQLADDEQTFVGKFLGPYQIVRVIQRGGMGVVFLAIDTKLHCHVALKILPPDLTSDAHRVQRFKQEARAASVVNHPSILTIHRIDEIDGVHFIVTEYVEGENLRQLIDRDPVELSQALEIGQQVVAALAVAHKAGIVHRDIKPENIMIRPDGLIKILDFGIAKLNEKITVDSNASTIIQTKEGAAIGTVRYMSPEQVRAMDVDARTDIWSFGLVLYELLTGAPPFDDQTAGDLIAKILGERKLAWPATPSVPAEVKEIVAKALQRPREKRYQSAEELLTDIRKVTVQFDRNRLSARRPAKKELIGLAAAILLTILSIGIVMKFAFRNSRATASVTSSSTSTGQVLTYGLTVQRMVAGKPVGPPFQASEQDSFANGSRFRLDFFSPQNGHLYLLDQTQGQSSALTILYPDPTERSEPTSVDSNYVLQTGWFFFDEHSGTEKLLIVWSARQVQALEAARRFLNEKDKGLISDDKDVKAIQQFLAAQAPPNVTQESDRKRTTAKTAGDVCVSAMLLDHR